MERKFKLMADYECWPLWDLDRPDNVDPGDLGLSPVLVRDLELWQDSFDATLNRDDPAQSGFASDEDRSAFEARGLDLLERLRSERPDDTFTYDAEV